jgi:hypothetical protein
MPFVDPRNSDEPPETADTSRSDEVDVEWSDTPVKIRKLVAMHDGALASFTERAVTRDDLHQLNSENESLRERIGELEQVVDVLAAVAPVSVTGDCPECDGELVISTRMLGDDTVECERCGCIVAVMENPV